MKEPRRQGKSQTLLALALAQLKPGQKLLILRADDNHITVTRNPEQIREKNYEKKP